MSGRNNVCRDGLPYNVDCNKAANIQYIIREAKDADIPAILEIASASITSSWTYDYVHDRLGRDDSLLFVAVDNSVVSTGNGSGASNPQVVGFASFRLVGDDGELLQIAVDVNRRRCGVGGCLLGAILDYSKNKALTSVFLEVRAGNAPAVALYKKFGFEPLRVRKGYYDNPIEDAVVMRFEM